MSLASVAADLKTALDTVDGVTGYVKRPGSPKVGDAWPLWRGGDRDQQSGLFDDIWVLAVYLPQDEEAANAWIDAHTDAIVTAVRAILYIDGRVPANLGTDASPVKGLMITGRF
jgi:hypothetical protein